MAQGPEQKGTQPPQPVEMTREEMESAYPGEWILARISQWEGRAPVTGVIIAHDKSDDEVANHLPKERDANYYFFKRDPRRNTLTIIPTQSRGVPIGILTTRRMLP